MEPNVEPIQGAPNVDPMHCGQICTWEPSMGLLYLKFNHIKTQCQDEFRNLSGCVIKILTAGRILQISIAWCQIEAEIRSFPTMYGKGGGRCGKIGEIEVSVQKLSLKQVFLRTQIWIISLQGLGPTISKVMPILICSPKTMGKKLQNELWARLVASKLSEQRPLTFFSLSGQKMGKNVIFPHFCQLLQCKHF